jgi:hypothetical protein
MNLVNLGELLDPTLCFCFLFVAGSQRPRKWCVAASRDALTVRDATDAGYGSLLKGIMKTHGLYQSDV